MKGALKPATPSPKADTRIQRKNRRLILDAALDIFSAHGFRGATVDQIALRAGMSKPNLLYYFRSKKAIYVALLEETLTEWLEPLQAIDADGDPVTQIGCYLEAKLELSRNRPAASRLFASEILHGAPAIGEFLRGPLKALVDQKAAIIDGWIGEGRLAAVDARHLIFMIWAVTQHYADFEVQVRSILDMPQSLEPHPAQLGRPTVLSVFFSGLKPR